MKTHRCEDSLKAKVSIRYDYKNKFMKTELDTEQWRIFHYIPIYDYGVVVPYHAAEIKYCPFCGEKLI